MSKNTNSCCVEDTEVPLSPKCLTVPALLQPAPFWSGVAIIDLKLRNISLEDYNDKYLILLFYPYDFTFVCPTELIQFSDRVEEFHNLGAEIVAISTDSVHAHLAWITTPRKQGGIGEMRMPMLADKSHEICKKYGVLDENLGIPYRALFVIDRKRLIRHITLNDVALPRSIDETLRVVQACQFVDMYGDTCPIGPKERRDTVDGDNNYFSST